MDLQDLMIVYGETLRSTVKKYKIQKLDLQMSIPKYKTVEEIHKMKY